MRFDHKTLALLLSMGLTVSTLTACTAGGVNTAASVSAVSSAGVESGEADSRTDTKSAANAEKSAICLSSSQVSRMTRT